MKSVQGNELAAFAVAGLLERLKAPKPHTGCGQLKTGKLGRVAPAPAVSVVVPMRPLSDRQREVISQAIGRLAELVEEIGELAEQLAAEEIDPANANSGAGRMFTKGQRPTGAATGQLAALYAALVDLWNQGAQPRNH